MHVLVFILNIYSVHFIYRTLLKANYFNIGNVSGVDSDKYEGGEEVAAADKGDAEEATEELCEAGQETAQQPAEQEAGTAN